MTAFYINYTNLQQPIFVLNPDNGVSYPRTVNASAAISKGIELGFQAIPYPGLQVQGAVTRLQGRYGEFATHDLVYPELGTLNPSTGLLDRELKGNSLPQAPDWQVNMSAFYSFALTDKFSLTPRIDWKWQSKVFFDIYNHALDSQADYQVTNVALTLGTMDSQWALTLSMRNVFDKRYVPQANDASSNINPTRAGTYGEPRVMGITLGYKYI